MFLGLSAWNKSRLVGAKCKTYECLCGAAPLVLALDVIKCHQPGVALDDDIMRERLKEVHTERGRSIAEMSSEGVYVGRLCV